MITATKATERARTFEVVVGVAKVVSHVVEFAREKTT